MEFAGMGDERGPETVRAAFIEEHETLSPKGLSARQGRRKLRDWVRFGF